VTKSKEVYHFAKRPKAQERSWNRIPI